MIFLLLWIFNLFLYRNKCNNSIYLLFSVKHSLIQLNCFLWNFNNLLAELKRITKNNRVGFTDGFVIMQCLEPVTNRPTGQLLLDYLTDTVIATKTTLPGIPFISPDSRKLVTLDRTENGATLIVQEITGTSVSQSIYKRAHSLSVLIW